MIIKSLIALKTDPDLVLQAPKEESGLRQLAINGRTDLFQLCNHFSLGNSKNSSMLYFNTTEPECYPVEVQIVEP